MRSPVQVALFLLCLTASARADIGDPGPALPCTTERVWTPSVDCFVCTATGGGAGCSARLPASPPSNPWRWECRTPGNLGWTELWCRRHDPVAPEKASVPALTHRVEATTASSTMAGSGGYRFDPSNLLDGDLTTSWQPASGRKGGKGEWVELAFKVEVQLSSVGIANGFQRADRFGDEFANNSRLRRARLVFSDGSEEKLSFDPERRGLAEFTFAPRRTRSLKLVADEVEPGSRWKDLAVSELVLLAGEAAAQDEPGPARTINFESGKRGTDGFERLSFTVRGGSIVAVKLYAGKDWNETSLSYLGVESLEGRRAFKVQLPGSRPVRVTLDGARLKAAGPGYSRTFVWSYEGPVDGVGMACEACVDEKDAIPLLETLLKK